MEELQKVKDIKLLHMTIHHISHCNLLLSPKGQYSREFQLSGSKFDPNLTEEHCQSQLFSDYLFHYQKAYFMVSDSGELFFFCEGRLQLRGFVLIFMRPFSL